MHPGHAIEYHAQRFVASERGLAGELVEFGNGRYVPTDRAYFNPRLANCDT
jgi:hypothetical protein